MHIVTGGAGFIGSNLVRGLNQRGVEDILVVDSLADPSKINNLSDCKITDFIDRDDFKGQLETGSCFGSVDALFHQGACSDTMATDGRLVMARNFDYSKMLFKWCQTNGISFIYASSASVYGGGTQFSELPENERPLNVYAFSKWLFDRYVNHHRQMSSSQVVGLRYFNVYGPREDHKERMASVAWHFFNQYREEGSVKLFEGSGGYEPGQQQRDFIYVGDVVDVNLFFLDHPQLSGIFNVGTANSQTFNEVAQAVINGCRRHDGEGPLSLCQLLSQGIIEYIPFPEALVGKYQSYTEADIGSLREIGYRERFLDVEEGVSRYLSTWLHRGQSDG